MSKDRQPWPMKWVVLAILLMIAPYTFITLNYRKENKPFEPYSDMKDRANTTRLLSAGYQRITLTAQRPAGDFSVPKGAQVAPTPGGVPEALGKTLVETPQLPTQILTVTAAPTANILQPYLIEFTCALPTDKQQLAGADLYVREQELVFIPTFGRIDTDLSTRSQNAIVLLTVPAGAVKPGTYAVTLVGEKGSKTWPLDVR